MEKSIDTQWLSARQILLLAPPSSELRALAGQVLRPPQYVVKATDDPAVALRILLETKIEVTLVDPEPGRTRSADVFRELQAADPFARVIVVAARPALAAVMAVLRRKATTSGGMTARQGRAQNDFEFDVLGLPCSAAELLQAVERAREIRYLRRADERGRRAEARMSAIVRSAPHAIVSFDASGLVHDWNPAAEAIFGWSAAEAVGRCFWEFALSTGGPLSGQPLVSGASARAEVVGRRRDGREFPAVMSLAAFAGEHPMWCGIIEDVAQARRLEIELRHAQKLEAVGRLAAGLAHEINTPSQFIAANSEFMAEGWAALDDLFRRYDDLRCLAARQPALAAIAETLAQAEDTADLSYLREHVPAALQAIGDGVRRITRIVSAMTGFARSDARERTGIDLNEALLNTLTVLESETRPAADVITDLGPVPVVAGYAADLNQAMLQIVHNAVHAVTERARGDGQRGTITVRTLGQGSSVLVEIGDNGIGIPDEIRHRIFEPFFTTKEVGRGSGLGLPVARAIIVDRHGGELTFESAVGVGTTFRIRLPVAPRDAS